MVLINPILQSNQRIKKKTRFFKLIEEETKLADEFDERMRTDRAFCAYIEREIDKAREEIERGEYYTTEELLRILEEEHKNYV